MNDKTTKRNIIKNNYAIEEEEREKTKVEGRQRETRSKK